MVNPLYPFTGHFFSRPCGNLHYSNEGRGEPVDGPRQPTWILRNSLRLRRYRGVPDHIGCGLSDKAPETV